MADQHSNEGTSHWLTTLTSGDWLKVPGAVKAIGRLVTSVGNIGAAGIEVGTAKLEQISHGIRDDTAAKSALSAAITKAGAKHAAANPALVERSVAHWLGEQVRHQENREAVAKIAVEHLNEGSPPPPNVEPSDDWLNKFEKLAEGATSEKLRETLGRILAGEIRMPGAFSYRTLHFVSLLDQDIARLVQKWGARVALNEFIPLTDEMQKDADLRELTTLESLGFLKTDLNVPVKAAPGQPRTIIYKKRALIISTEGEVSHAIQIALLTDVGKSIHAILDYDDDEPYLRSVALNLKARLAGKVHIADINPQTIEFSNLTEVA